MRHYSTIRRYFGSKDFIVAQIELASLLGFLPRHDGPTNGLGVGEELGGGDQIRNFGFSTGASGAGVGAEMSSGAMFKSGGGTERSGSGMSFSCSPW